MAEYDGEFTFKSGAVIKESITISDDEEKASETLAGIFNAVARNFSEQTGGYIKFGDWLINTSELAAIKITEKKK